MTRPEHDLQTIENIMRLRRAEQLGTPAVRAEVAPVRASLEAMVGATISPSLAARMLGVTQPALRRWFGRGEIASVLSPEGRRVVPLSELLPLMEDVRRVRQERVGRPLTRVLRERSRKARESIDVDQLLPKRKPRRHRVAELQSLAYHRLVARGLDARLVDEARERLRRWRDEGRIHPEWVAEWERILALSLPDIREALSADSVSASHRLNTSLSAERTGVD